MDNDKIQERAIKAERHFRLALSSYLRGISPYAYDCIRHAAHQGNKPAQVIFGTRCLSQGNIQDGMHYLLLATGQGTDPSSAYTMPATDTVALHRKPEFVKSFEALRGNINCRFADKHAARIIKIAENITHITQTVNGAYVSSINGTHVNMAVFVAGVGLALKRRKYVGKAEARPNDTTPLLFNEPGTSQPAKRIFPHHATVTQAATHAP